MEDKTLTYIPYKSFQKGTSMDRSGKNDQSKPLIRNSPIFRTGVEEVDARTTFAPGTVSPPRSRKNTLESQNYRSRPRSRSNASEPIENLEREGDEDVDIERENRKRNVSGKRDSVDAKSDIPEIRNNMYQAKKMVAQGLLDIALLTANASQLKNLIETENHPHYELAMTLLCMSIVLQIVVAILLLVIGRMDFGQTPETTKKETKTAVLLNDISTVGVFLITTVNIFIASFISHGKAYIPSGSAEAAYNEKIFQQQRALWEKSAAFRNANLTGTI